MPSKFPLIGGAQPEATGATDLITAYLCAFSQGAHAICRDWYRRELLVRRALKQFALA